MRQSPGSSRFAHSHRNRGPSLHQRYPASSLLHPHPPSAAADSTPHGVVVAQLPAGHHHGLPLLHDRSFRHACCHHYPGGCDACVSRSLRRRRRPSSLLWRVGIHDDISRPAQCLLTLRPAWPAGLLRGLFKKCFSPFVTSWTAPCASGRSESWPGRTSPTDQPCLSKAHTTTGWRTRSGRSPSAGRTGCSRAACARASEPPPS